ncbi:hypothetical protein BN1232_02217 [Mycobacterium lentiflavum]|uniref:Uncharacterized protein n=1 Tax=Mycobacterium lentiflavum TaxID=141349 RepID=A0A0E4GX43_MYCLN|nr:hypothetical protein [Mycobacterium lentiflavum]CQD11798.1 hypothetical protein BN1232_02217 [Mycobacterium lentiflavum]
MTVIDEHADADQGAETKVGQGAADETELIAPAQGAGMWSEDGAAWSDYQRDDQLVREGPSWKQVSLIAAAIFVPLTAVAAIITSWLSQPESKPSVTGEPARVITVPAAAPQVPAVVPPPVTVTAPPPVTVTQTAVVAPPPVTVTAPPADETFLICPDGHSGVATGVTSCQFAMNVRTSYLRQGGPTVIAYSPVTGDSYEMDCRTGYSARLANSMTVNSVRCVGGNNAVVILW